MVTLHPSGLRDTGTHRRLSPAEQRDLQARLATREQQLDDIAFDYCDLKQRYEAAVAEIRRLQQQHIDDTVRADRLHRDLQNVRPRITATPAEAPRPTAPDSVPLPHAA
ncbi:hypothetical protein [Streptomyces sp. NPDC097640]|uniref:hypothetical protein n=1 Tax=Streptomyces sp. NPDC097640 TaxID=3157229 RepID=UPI00331A0A27